jgi:hypothetical protein
LPAIFNSKEVSMSSKTIRSIRVELGPDDSLVYSEEKKGHLGEKKRSYSHKNALDYFQWISDSGALEVSFPGRHPFEEHPVRSEAGKPTPPVRVSAKAGKGEYKYNVTLTDKLGKQHHEDPVIIIHDVDGDPRVDGDNSQSLN